MTGLAAEVALDGATNAYDRLIGAPEKLRRCAGVQRTVPFGKGNIKTRLRQA